MSDSKPSSQQEKPAGRLERFTAWRVSHISDNVTLIITATLIGLASGFGAFLLKIAIDALTSFFAGYMVGQGPNYFLLVVPVAGIVITQCYQKYIVHRNLMHGEGQLASQLDNKDYFMPRKLIYAPLIASTITLGLGGSAGSEGPIATSGAAIGSNIGRVLGLPSEMVRILIGCGAGAGIAGIFKSPIGGVLFTLEVLKMNLNTMSVLALIVSSLCGALTCFMLTGFTPDINFVSFVPFDSRWMIWIMLLGVFCGVYSMYYSAVIGYMQRLFKRFHSTWVMNIAGGAILATCLFLFPVLYGEGYNVMTAVCNGHFDIIMYGSIFKTEAMYNGVLMAVLVFAVLMLKAWACVASNSAGGVAGDFAPTIFAGAMAGFVFASGVNIFFEADLPVGIFALLGTAGVFAGVIHAPLMAMFLTAEMSNGYGLLLGLATAAALSYLTVKLINPRSIYENVRHDDLMALLNPLHNSKKYPR